MIYTGIGSRSTPIHIQDVMTSVAYQLAESGWTLRSGHADGADMAFEEGCVQQAKARSIRPRMEIYLPWQGFNGAVHGIVPIPNGELIRIASMFHPAWDRCKPAAKFLHMRNVPQVVGINLDTASDMIICWTPQGKRTGGTGQALRIAEYLNIPIFDLAIPGIESKLSQFVEEKENEFAAQKNHTTSNHEQAVAASRG